MLFKANLEKVLREILTLAEKSNKLTIFTIGIAPRKRDTETLFFPFIRESSLAVIGNVEINRTEEAFEIVKLIDGIIDYIIIDDEKKSPDLFNLTKDVKKLAKKSIVLTYKDNDAWVEATDALISQFLVDALNKNILIFTINNLSSKLALKLCERGSNVYLYDPLVNTNAENLINVLNFILPEVNPSKIHYLKELTKQIDYDVVVGFSIDLPIITLNEIKDFSQNSIIIDAGIGSISEEGIKYALENNFTIFRLDMRAGLSGNLINIIETYDLKNNIYGRKKFRNFNIVAGGFFGITGDIVVDSIKKPSKVIGVADGKGHLISSEKIKDYEDRIKEVQEEILHFKD